MNIRAVGKYVIVERIVPKVPETGIYVPNAKEDIHRGRVVSVGDQVYALDQSHGWEEGALVLYSKNAGVPLDVGEHRYVALKGDEDLLGVVEP